MRSTLRTFGFVAILLTAVMSADAAELPRRPAFGVAMANTMPPDVRAAQKLAADEGVLVVAVQPGLSADAAGLKAGDVLVSLDGKRLGSPADVAAVLRAKRVGDAMTIGYVRNDARVTTSVALKATPFESAPDFDVVYDAVTAGPSVRRSLITRPRSKGRHPAVLLVGGIGCPSYDQPLNDNDPYKQLVYALTRQGFITLRVEKSGVGDSTGKPCPEVDLNTEVEGYVAGLRMLKRLSGVDAARTFIVGHSIGGVVGPLVAAQEPVRGLFVMETLGITWFEYELINTRRQLKLGGMSPAEIGAQMILKEWCSHRLLIERAPRADILKAKPECADYMAYPASDTYVQQVAAQNYAGLWAALKGVDVAVLYGAADFVTGADESKALVEAANAVRAGSADYIELPDMDHYLVQSPSQAASLQRVQSGGAGVFHPRLAKIVGDWLKTMVR